MTLSAGGLASVVRALEDRLDWEFDSDDLDDKIRLQKYIYLAEEFGLDHDYSYNLYVYGPYSPSLTEDYYELDRDSGDPSEATDLMDLNGLIDLVEDKDRRWLEVAATIRKVRSNRAPFTARENLREKTIEKASEVKNEDEEYVTEVYSDLESAT